LIALDEQKIREIKVNASILTTNEKSSEFG